MLHQIKRTVGRAQQPLKGPANAEYLDLRQRLTTIKSALQYTSQMLDYANRGWVMQMQAQRTFSERFVESYPTPGEEMHVIAQQFAAGSQRLYDTFIRRSNPDMKAYQHIHHQVTLYIREIEHVESFHSRLAAAKSEADRYQSKVDYMERRRKAADESKKTRNLLKMDVEKVNYRNLLAEVVAMQKATYAKYPVVFKAALVSYWLSHEKHVTMLVESLRETQEFAKGAEAEMSLLDIKKLDLPYQHKGPIVHCSGLHIEDEQRERDLHLREMSRTFRKMEIPGAASSRSVSLSAEGSPVSEGDGRPSTRLSKAKSVKMALPEKLVDAGRGALSKAKSMKVTKSEKAREVRSAPLYGTKSERSVLMEKVLSEKAVSMDSLRSAGSDRVEESHSVKSRGLTNSVAEVGTEVDKDKSGKEKGKEKSKSIGEVGTKEVGTSGNETLVDEGAERNKQRDREGLRVGNASQVVGVVDVSREGSGRISGAGMYIGRNQGVVEEKQSTETQSSQTNEYDSFSSTEAWGKKESPQETSASKEIKAELQGGSESSGQVSDSNPVKPRRVRSIVDAYESGTEKKGELIYKRQHSGLKTVLKPSQEGL